MVKEIGIIDNRTGKFHPSSRPTPTRKNDGSVNTAVASGAGHALMTGRPAQIATRTTDSLGRQTVKAHGTVRSVLKGAKGGSGNQLGRSTSNKNI